MHDGIGAADQKLLQLADPTVERVGDVKRPLAERRIDFCDPFAESVGELDRARVDQRRDVADALVDGGGDLLAAVSERFGDIDHARRQCIGEGLRTAVQRLLEAPQALIESGGDFIGLCGNAIVEAVDVSAHRLRHVLRARAEPFDELGAIGLHGAIEFGEMAGDQIAECRGVARDAFAEFRAGVIEHVLEGGKACRQHFLHCVVARGDDAGDVLGALAHLIGHRSAARNHGLGELTAGLLQLVRDFAAAKIEIDDEQFAGRFKCAVNLFAADRDRLGELARGFDDGFGQFLRSSDHQVDDGERLLGERFGDPVEPSGHHIFQAGRDLGEFLADVIGLEIEARTEPFAGRGDRLRRFAACRLQPIQKIAAALAQLRDHAVADLAERQRDVLAALRKRLRDALRRLVDLLADQVADRGKILRQIDMDVVDHGANLLGLADQRVALAGEILQQPANPYFVVAISAFERGNLVLHQSLKFARSRQCPLDAVAHGGDLATDRLADGDDGIPCNALGLGEPHGDPRHRLRDQAQLLGAPGHMRDAEEENDGQQSGGAKADHQRNR